MTLAQRLAGGALEVGTRLLQVLPDRPVYRVAHILGVMLSYLMPARRRLARANLGRVCRSLAASGRATPRVRAAAGDGRLLDAMVRDVFGQWVVTYVESAMAPRYDAATLRARIRDEDPATTAAALALVPVGRPGPIFVGLHLGSVELAALYASRLGHVPVTAPMERLRDPVLRAYFERTRQALGVRVIPITGAASELRARIRQGEGAALVADRPIGGRGTLVELFGAPARIPAGPAVLAVETGAPMYLLAVQRLGPGTWTGRMSRIEIPQEGTRRDRVRMTLEAQVRSFEGFIAEAPEQWWTLLFRVWEEDTAA